MKGGPHLIYRYRPPASTLGRFGRASAAARSNRPVSCIRALDNGRGFNTGNLAFLGDALWALHVRQLFLYPPKHIRKYHEAADVHVTAEAQARYHDLLVSLDRLTADERRVMAKAAEGTVGFRSRFKGREAQEQYRKATALEALIGFLHMTDEPRFEEVMAWLTEIIAINEERKAEE